MAGTDALTPLQRAAYTIRSLREKLAATDRSDPIAIIGMACRFPGGASTPERFWELLAAARDAVGPVPPDRWDADALYDPDPARPGHTDCRQGGFLDEPIADFDAEFFGVSPREAAWTDPQQRLSLEVAWEALESAGVPVRQAAGSSTGVWVGVMGNDYGRRPLHAVDMLDMPYVGTGNELSFMAGRLSYALGLRGPSMAVSTACSSSLVSVHLACRALRDGECEMALAGGVNLLVSPDNSIVLSKMRATSADGRCRTFDAAASGYGRAEGCGFVVLKRLQHAQRDGDRVLALLVGSAVNHGGAGAGITVPNATAQQRVLRAALADAGLQPHDVGYLEAHGTGTALGDPIELGAVESVLGTGRADPLWVGSVKSNIGHLEAAAGIAGLIKAVLVLQHEAIPPQLHFHTPNPRIEWERSHFAVPTTTVPWPRDDRTGRPCRIVGVSGFGLSGVNAHVLVREAPPPAAETETETERPGPYLLALSARNPQALAELTERMRCALAATPSVDAFCETSITGRTQLLPHRLAVVGTTRDELRSALCSARLQLPPAVQAPPALGWLFTGQGSQLPQMGEGLREAFPSYRQALEQCEDRLGLDLRTLGDDIHQTGLAQPALFALEYALASLWRSWGVQPSVVMGHSLGECVAACVAGVLSLEDALTMVSARGRLMQALPTGGAMASVRAAPELVSRHLVPGVEVAAINGPSAVVISGPEEALFAVLEALPAPSRRLQVSHAFHSPLVEPMLEAFAQVCRGLRYATPNVPMISNVSGRIAGAEVATADYWVQHVRQCVRFGDGIAAARAQADAFLEIGPSPTLLAMGRAALAHGAGRAVSASARRGSAEPVWLPSLRPGKPDREQLLQTAAELFTLGAALQPKRGRRPVDLPSYPFQRARHWRALPAWGAAPAQSSALTRHPLLGAKLESPHAGHHYSTRLRSDDPSWLADHRVFGQVLVPGAAWIEMALATGASELLDVVFEHPLALSDQSDQSETRVDLIVDEHGAFRIYSAQREGDSATSSWQRHAAGRTGTAQAPRARPLPSLTEQVDIAALYGELAAAGLEYGDTFRGLRRLLRGEGEALAWLELPDHVNVGAFKLHPALLDAALQAVAGALSSSAEHETYLPVSVGRLSLYRSASQACVHVQLNAAHTAHTAHTAKDGSISVELSLQDSQGRPVAELSELRLRRASRESLLDRTAGQTQRWLYEVAWEPAPKPRPEPAADGGPGSAWQGRRWLLLGEQAQALGRQLSAAGHQIAATLDETVTDVVDLRPLDLARAIENVDDATGPSPAELQQITVDGCAGLMELVQTLARRDSAPTLVVVTQNVTHSVTHSAFDAAALAGLAGAAQWGMARVIAQEHPELRCKRIDLQDAPEALQQALLSTLLTTDDEPEQALLPTGRRVARLTRYGRDLRTGEAANLQLAADATYLIAGGTSGIGLQLARHLATHGARYLLLFGRTAATHELRAQLERELGREHGIELLIGRADVANLEQLRALLSEVPRDWPPVRGVVHSAGVLDDGLLLNLSRERLQHPMSAKVAGAWALHQATAHLPLDFFVLMSSAVGTFGAVGQAGYAAANSFEDRLAGWLRGRGVPAIAIGWGAWAEIGMAASPAIQSALAARGMRAIAPEQGAEVFGQLLHHDAAHVVVVPIDWPRLLARVNSAFFAHFVGDASETSGAKAPATARLGRVLAGLPAAEQRERLWSHLESQIKRVLGLGPAEYIDGRRGLFELGMDSLMALDLRTRLQDELGRQLSSTLVFDHPSVEALVEHLLPEAPASPGSSPGGSTAYGTPATTDKVEDKAELRQAVRAILAHDAEASDEELQAALSEAP